MSYQVKSEICWIIYRRFHLGGLLSKACLGLVFLIEFFSDCRHLIPNPDINSTESQNQRSF